MYEEHGIWKFGLIYETRGPKFSSSRKSPKFNGPALSVGPLDVPNLIG